MSMTERRLLINKVQEILDEAGGYTAENVVQVFEDWLRDQEDLERERRSE